MSNKLVHKSPLILVFGDLEIGDLFIFQSSLDDSIAGKEVAIYLKARTTTTYLTEPIIIKISGPGEDFDRPSCITEVIKVSIRHISYVCA